MTKCEKHPVISTHVIDSPHSTKGQRANRLPMIFAYVACVHITKFSLLTSLSLVGFHLQHKRITCSRITTFSLVAVRLSAQPPIADLQTLCYQLDKPTGKIMDSCGIVVTNSCTLAHQQ
jgi:hypothetical protein